MWPPGAASRSPGRPAPARRRSCGCSPGSVRPDRGRIALGDEVWVDTAAGVWWPPERRRCGYVFQDYALFPHLSAWRNVAYGLRSRPSGERKANRARAARPLRAGRARPTPARDAVRRRAPARRAGAGARAGAERAAARRAAVGARRAHPRERQPRSWPRRCAPSRSRSCSSRTSSARRRCSATRSA